MKRETIIRLNKSFEESAYQENGLEYWLARDLQVLLDYDEWRNFSKVIEKAKTACVNSGQDVADHFVDVNKMVKLGSGSERQLDDMMLTRYACYLIAQNGDPRKEQIALAQSYFAIQARKQNCLKSGLTRRAPPGTEKLVATETELSRSLRTGRDTRILPHQEQRRPCLVRRTHDTADEEKTGNPGKQASGRFSPHHHHQGKRSCNGNYELQCKKRRLAGRRVDYRRARQEQQGCPRPVGQKQHQA